MKFPTCPSCNKSVLVPLSDYAPEGASVRFKAWACTRPECGHSVRADKGQVAYERIAQDRPTTRR